MKTRYILAVSASLALAASAFAQTGAQSYYFLDNSLFGYRTNASIQSEKSFFSIAIGGINPAISSNIGVSTLLYPTADGKLVTGLNSQVSSSEFLSKLLPSNNLALDMNANLFAIGKRKEKGFSNFEVNLRSLGTASLPKDVFALLKDGSRTDPYDLSQLDFNATAYAEIAYGISRKVGPLQIGARVKGLIGLANINLDVTRADLQMNGAGIAYNIDARFLSAAPYLTFPTKEGTTDVLDVTKPSLDMSKIGIAGIGYAFDLGATLAPIDGLTISAGLNDIGKINWNYNTVGQTSGTDKFTGISEIDTESTSSGSIGSELKDAADKLAKLADFKTDGTTQKIGEKLPVVMNAGARYHLPFFKRLSVGALYTSRISETCGWYDFRGGVTLTPFNFLSITGNAGKTTFGNTIGAAASINLIGINFHIAVDSYYGSISKINLDSFKVPVFGGVPIPLDPFRFNASFGANITFGKRQVNYKRPEKADIQAEPASEKLSTNLEISAQKAERIDAKKAEKAAAKEAAKQEKAAKKAAKEENKSVVDQVLEKAVEPAPEAKKEEPSAPVTQPAVPAEIAPVIPNSL